MLKDIKILFFLVLTLFSFLFINYVFSLNDQLTSVSIKPPASTDYIDISHDVIIDKELESFVKFATNYFLPKALDENYPLLEKDWGVVDYSYDNMGAGIWENGYVEIWEINGDYATGEMWWSDDNKTPKGAGFYWGAAKINGKWAYYFNGNGGPSCEEVKIFPVGTFKSGRFNSCGMADGMYERQKDGSFKLIKKWVDY